MSEFNREALKSSRRMVGGRAVLAALGLAVLVGCTTPPIDTPKNTITITLADIWPQAPDNTPVLVPTNLPPFQINKSQGGIAIPVPASAHNVNIAAATLHLQIKNDMKLPLSLTFYMAKDDPYNDASKIGSATIDPGQTKSIDSAFDTQLLKNDVIHAGVDVGIGQTNGLVTVNRNDPLTTTVWSTVQVKLF